MMKAASKLHADGPPFPDLIEYVWEWFVQHLMGLAPGGFDLPRVTWEGLEAWSRLMCIDLEPWEAELMVTLSTARASIQADKIKVKK